MPPAASLRSAGLHLILGAHVWCRDVLMWPDNQADLPEMVRRLAQQPRANVHRQAQNRQIEHKRDNRMEQCNLPHVGGPRRYISGL